ncbi:metallophosphoesterase [Rarobacter incanus]|uniref:Putative MPP superfamily phosphohydrolase n=1 Tax=Rarobacter incanus TaxID=153494 RepID=A0A542SP91_9MICO|nr:metallophosphoesterase [Rarobacter incanus]TQK76440.1 putative MPP superfamily phosphohydrolase [Rarobacter incanus]
MREPKRPTPRRLALAAGVSAAAAGAALAWGAIESHLFTVRDYRIPILPAGTRPLRILQVSDLHLIPEQADKIAWVRELATLEPDFVLNTGDNFGSPQALWPLLHALEPLLAFPGGFVLGSNDYFSPQFRNPLRYLLGHSGQAARRRTHPDLPWQAFTQRMEEAGWLDLNNQRHLLAWDRIGIDLVGLDDPHIGRDSLPPRVASREDSPVRVGIVHAPYRRALDTLHADGAQFIIAGHTHGGQICVPWFGALTSNCDLPPRLASGLHTWPDCRRGAVSDRDPSWLHVSEGVGTNPFVRLRFACRPAASMLTLVPRGEGAF